MFGSRHGLPQTSQGGDLRVNASKVAKTSTVRVLRPLVATVACVLAGCGAGPTFPTVHSSSGGSHPVASWLHWDQCLRNHGVRVPAGYDPYNPKGIPKPDASVVVINACQRYAPPAPPLSAAARQKAVQTSNCMRAHGFANRLTFTSQGSGMTFARGLSPTTPGFDAALIACGLPAYRGG